MICASGCWSQNKWCDCSVWISVTSPSSKKVSGAGRRRLQNSLFSPSDCDHPPPAVMGRQPALGRVTPAVVSRPTGFNPSTFHLLKKYFVLCGPLKALNVQINNSTFTIFATTWHHETDSGQTKWRFLRRKSLSLNHMTQILPLPVVLTVVVPQL